MNIHCIVGCALVGPLIAVGGLIYGFVRGRSFGWQEGYLTRERNEMNRRNKLGQFRKVSE